MAKCSGITQAGAACKGIPIDGSQWCYVHHPGRVEERRRHGSKGGRRGGRGRPQAELSDIKRRLLELAEDVLAHRQNAGAASIAGQLLNTYIRAVSVELRAREQMELIERLEALEAALESRKDDRRWGA